MTYLLVHSMAHHVMHGIARFSGLDLGSLSEVIFPADLAFVVHRRGMTEDLGNISSMWRDQNAAFLRYLVARRELTLARARAKGGGERALPAPPLVLFTGWDRPPAGAIDGAAGRRCSF